jgi:ribosomal protein S18 acetylase RimI-like enzyme
MTQSADRWQITPDAGDDQFYAMLARDPVWNSFALADLEPPLREYSQFAVAIGDSDQETAICLFLRHPVIGEVLSPFGDAEGVEAILAHCNPPEHPLIQAQDTHVRALTRYYRPETIWRAQWRMAITSASQLSLPASSPHPVQHLTVADLPALRALYSRDPESAFAAELFPEGLYFGLYQGNAIVAAAGTHVLCPAHSIAVLGNVLTAPEARRQGYAAAVTAALVRALLDQGIAAVVLNVFVSNLTAIGVYERLGFATHNLVWTGRAVKHFPG